MQREIIISTQSCIPWGKYGAVIPIQGSGYNTELFPNISRTRLLENGKELLLKNSDPWKTGRFGRGRYTFFDGKLYFSASDNTSIFDNGRRYVFLIDAPRVSAEFYPRDVGIEITNICNAKCCYCPLYQNNENALKAEKGYMEMALFQKIIDEIAEWPVYVSIYLNNGGEPLLDRHFEERIEYCVRKGVSERIILQTNAEYLTQQKAKILLDAGISYIFPAFDGATKETYEKHRVNCHFETVYNNICTFAEMRDAGDYSTSIQVKFMRTKWNEAELIDAYNLFCKVLSQELDHFQEEYAHTWNEENLKKQDFALTVINSAKIVRECRMAHSYLPIYKNGDVGSCSLDYNCDVFRHPLGNVGGQTLLEIWNGRDFNRLRRAMGRVVRLPVKNRILQKLCGLPDKCADCYLMYYKEGDIDNLLPGEKLFCKAAFSSYIYKF